MPYKFYYTEAASKYYFLVNFPQSPVNPGVSILSELCGGLHDGCIVLATTGTNQAWGVIISIIFYLLMENIKWTNFYSLDDWSRPCFLGSLFLLRLSILIYNLNVIWLD